MQDKTFSTIIASILILFITGCSITGNAVFSHEKEDSKEIAEKWLRYESPTYTFDGRKITYLSSQKIDNCNNCYAHHFSFISEHIGYGNRSDELDLSEFLVSHHIVIATKENKVISAIIDDSWDDLRSKEYVLNTRPDNEKISKGKENPLEEEMDMANRLMKQKLLCKMRNMDCPETDKPVCADTGVTYKNECYACRDSDVSYYSYGECS
ncbi:MAG: Kazal-type serine protease inhibitor family protein [Candidatus Woesearchaeota archaeon]